MNESIGSLEKYFDTDLFMEENDLLVTKAASTFLTDDVCEVLINSLFPFSQRLLYKIKYIKKEVNGPYNIDLYYSYKNEKKKYTIPYEKIIEFATMLDEKEESRR